MANMNRADMINSLALAMGVNAPGSVINNKKYDTQTGTIYCKDRPVSDDTVKNAIHYFETLKAKYAKSDASEIRTVANYYDVAISALMAYQDQKKLKTGSKLAM